MNNAKNKDLSIIHKEKDYVDSRAEHNQVLMELGLLDDDDDYQLYLKQQEKFEAIHQTIPDEAYSKYMDYDDSKRFG